MIPDKKPDPKFTDVPDGKRTTILFLFPLVLIIVLSSCQPGFNPYHPGTGVSLELAHYRESDLRNLRYSLSFTIPEKSSRPVNGFLSLRFTRKRLSDPLILDFKEDSSRLLSVNLNDKPARFAFRDEHLIVFPGNFTADTNALDIEFVAGDLSLNRNDDYLYTLLVPDRARTLFPCIDQPGLKGTFQLRLRIPGHWKAVTNSPLLLKDTLNPEYTELLFDETPPLPVYLFAFAAGRFDTISFRNTKHPMVLYHRENDVKKIRNNAAAIFRLADSSLCFMERYTGIAYPFPKYDLVAIPSFQYGGMEHPGCIFLNASRVFLAENPSADDLMERANLIAHETAHIWFGDYVTMPWFDEVWMKEVFAGFMADKITGYLFLKEDFRLRFLLAHYPPSYDIDRTQGTNPIAQKLVNLNIAGSLYGNIIYHKAPIAIMQLEKLAGEDVFRQALREYLSEHPYGTAGWKDLATHLPSLPETSVKNWTNAWLHGSGVPEIIFRVRTEKERPIIRITHRKHSGDAHILPQYVKIAWVSKGKFISCDSIFLNRTTANLILSELVTTRSVPLPNPDGTTYGIILPDKKILDSCFAFLASNDDTRPVTRASLWIMLYENLLADSIHPEIFFRNLLHTLQIEKEPLLSSRLQKYLTRTYWQMLPPSVRGKYNRKVEHILWTQMQRAEKESKRTFFFSWLSVMESKEAMETCRQILEGSLVLPGFTPDEKDKNRIALELGLRDSAHWKSILLKRIEECSNPDEKARMQFILPALSPEIAERDSYFASLSCPKNREHEPWVLTALSFLHHPLRQNTSVRYLHSSLEMLEKIRNTGDIFFPERWLEATFSLYNSPEAVATVNEFLIRNPNYPSDLKAKILQQTDMAFRAEHIIKHYFH
ncbi:MAG TPA: M1 family aminopeptidase [Bacteroidales bacterium]|nr:M1 family aminopeptidase [Bacteroidales bacterium]